MKDFMTKSNHILARINWKSNILIPIPSFFLELIKRTIENLGNFKKDFGFSQLDPSHDFFSEVSKNFFGKIKMGTAPQLDLDDAVILSSECHSFIIKQNSSHCKHRGVQNQNKYTLGDYKLCLENRGIEYGAKYYFRSNKHEIWLVKLTKIASSTYLVMRDVILIKKLVYFEAINLLVI